MTKPVRVAVTGAAGQISYGTLFRIAAGDMLGADQPVILQLLEITPALDALRGVVMELDDCAFPLLHDVVATDDAETAFGDWSLPFPRQHYFWGLLTGHPPKPLEDLTLRLLAGSQRGGIKCAGGICRRYPVAVGGKLEAVYRF